VTPTPEQQDLAAAIGRVLQADAEIEAAWLGGSLGRGAGDAFSDVDVIALVADGAAAAVGRRYAADVSAIAEAVLVMPLYRARIVSVVTSDWRRFDLSFIEAADLARYAAGSVSVLFNKGVRSPPTQPRTTYQATPATVLPLVKEFLRVAGLASVAFGRQEWILALSGLQILRGLTLDLMLEENGVGPAERGGALRRNPFLSEEQRRALEQLAPVAANRESLLAANLEIAAVFLPRARRLAARIGAEWPTAFEDATRRHLQARLGLLLP